MSSRTNGSMSALKIVGALIIVMAIAVLTFGELRALVRVLASRPSRRDAEGNL
jgi:uncharacterized membrane protein